MRGLPVGGAPPQQAVVVAVQQQWRVGAQQTICGATTGGVVGPFVLQMETIAPRLIVVVHGKPSVVVVL